MSLKLLLQKAFLLPIKYNAHGLLYIKEYKCEIEIMFSTVLMNKLQILFAYLIIIHSISSFLTESIFLWLYNGGPHFLVGSQLGARSSQLLEVACDFLLCGSLISLLKSWKLTSSSQQGIVSPRCLLR